MTLDSASSAAFELPGSCCDGAALRCAPDRHGLLVLNVTSPGAGPSAGVTVARGWLLPLAAWFAGEAEQRVHPGRAYEDTLIVLSDESALVWNAASWAQLHCLTPYGNARVRTQERGHVAGTSGAAVFLSPGDRQEAALRLRRIGIRDAKGSHGV